jgi:hypothetical protein
MEVKDDKEQSPVKKRRGSSKSLIKEATCTPHKVTPPENQAQGEVAPSIMKTTKFIEMFIYPLKRLVIELAITLNKVDTFDVFAKALTALLAMHKYWTQSLS